MVSYYSFLNTSARARLVRDMIASCTVCEIGATLKNLIRGTAEKYGSLKEFGESYASCSSVLREA